MNSFSLSLFEKKKKNLNVFFYLIILHTGDWHSQLFPDRNNSSVQFVLYNLEFEGMKSTPNLTLMVKSVMSLYWLSLSVKGVV